MNISGIEINKRSIRSTLKIFWKESFLVGSVLIIKIKNKVDLVLIKGVLIHINPDMLPTVMKNIFFLKYILVCEYYNPPLFLFHRGHIETVYLKRFFAGEMLEKYLI